MSNDITIEQFKAAMPANFRGGVNVDLLNKVNAIVADPHIGQMLRENLISYTGVMRDGKFKMEDYIYAVKYVSHKLMGNSNLDAYVKTFPQRYQAFLGSGAPAKDIHAHVSAYNKNKLVNLIMEQTLVPTHVLNADVYQQAINVQAELMLNAVSEKVRCDAANSLLNHLKRPEASKVELSIGVAETGVIKELRDVTMQLAAKQRQMIEGGLYSAQDIAHDKLVIEGEVNHVETV